MICQTCQNRHADWVASTAEPARSWMVCHSCKTQAERLSPTVRHKRLPSTMTANTPQVTGEAVRTQIRGLWDTATPMAGTARRTDPDTSQIAATRNPVRRGTHRHQIMQAFLTAVSSDPPGLTAEQATDLAGLNPRSSPWKRVSELHEQGWLTDTGERRITQSGSPAMVLTVPSYLIGEVQP